MTLTAQRRRTGGRLSTQSKLLVCPTTIDINLILQPKLCCPRDLGTSSSVSAVGTGFRRGDKYRVPSVRIGELERGGLDSTAIGAGNDLVDRNVRGAKYHLASQRATRVGARTLRRAVRNVDRIGIVPGRVGYRVPQVDDVTAGVEVTKQRAARGLGSGRTVHTKKARVRPLRRWPLSTGFPSS